MGQLIKTNFTLKRFHTSRRIASSANARPSHCRKVEISGKSVCDFMTFHKVSRSPSKRLSREDPSIITSEWSKDEGEDEVVVLALGAGIAEVAKR